MENEIRDLVQTPIVKGVRKNIISKMHQEPVFDSIQKYRFSNFALLDHQNSSLMGYGNKGNFTPTIIDTSEQRKVNFDNNINIALIRTIDRRRRGF